MSVSINIGLFLQRIPGRLGNLSPPPLSAPRDISASETATAITFTWKQPVSWGSAGPHSSNRYVYQIRQTQQGGPALSDRQGDPTGWTNPRVHNSTTLVINWLSSDNQEEIIQMRVAARDNNRPPVVSDYTTSQIYNEGSVSPSGIYSRAYHRAYA